MIGILDIDLGNLASVANAVQEQGFDTLAVLNIEQLDHVTHLIITGVGHFRTAMEHLKAQGLLNQLVTELEQRKMPTLGICLGMQLMGAYSEEGDISGLGIVPGTVHHLGHHQLRVPHVGWNTVKLKGHHPLFADIKPDRDFYFVHSYAFAAQQQPWALAETDYGQPFTSVIGRDHFIGLQFHPEKSQLNGLKIIENFCFWDGLC